MIDFESSLFVNQLLNEEDRSVPVETRCNNELDVVIDALNENLITIDRQSDSQMTTASNLFFSNSSGNRVKASEKIEIAIKHLAYDYKKTETETYYKYLEQYNGVVESINYELETFSATLTNIIDDTHKLFAEFDFDDLQYPSDKELINVGASFIWLIGKEAKKTGQQTNMSKFVFRRTKALSPRKIKEAERDANEWTEFFKSIFISGSTE